MKVITVRQPWAWAIMHGGKDVENRSRNIAGSYRGPIAIHAGLTHEKHNMASEAHRAAHGSEVPTDLVFGAIIGTVDLVDVHTAKECYERDLRRLVDLYRNHRAEYRKLPNDGNGLIGKINFCSQWAMDEHHHLVFANPQPLATPIPAKGRLGLWNFGTEQATP